MENTTHERCPGCRYRHDPADEQAHQDGLDARREQNAEYHR